MQQTQSITEKEAVQRITAEDSSRARWAQYLYKTDITNPCLYDMVLHIKTMKVHEAARIICHAAQMEAFQATPESKQAVFDLALKSRVMAAIENTCKPDLKVTVTATKGSVHIRAETRSIRKTGYTNPKTDTYVKETMEQEIADEIAGAIKEIPEIKTVAYEIIPPSYS